MKTNNIIIVCLALTIIGIGTLVLPTADEQISTLVKDRAYDTALMAAEERYTAGDRTSEILLALHLLRSYFGDIEGATHVLEQIAVQQPENIEVQLQLAEHYKSILRIDLYVSVLEGIVKQDITQPVAHILLGHYRYLGNTEAEIRLLERLIQANHAAPSMIGRLGLLLLSHGDLARATELLLLFDRKMTMSARAERLTLFELLVDSGRFDQAYERAIAWTKEWRDPDVASYMAERFRIEGKHIFAAKLTAAARVHSFADQLTNIEAGSTSAIEAEENNTSELIIRSNN